MEQVKFNDTDRYKHLILRGHPGVFTEEHIDDKSLPEGYYLNFTGMPFDMESFFGSRESIQLQINKAEEKRNDMLGEKPERQHNRSTTHEEEQFL